MFLRQEVHQLLFHKIYTFINFDTGKLLDWSTIIFWLELSSQSIILHDVHRTSLHEFLKILDGDTGMGITLMYETVNDGVKLIRNASMSTFKLSL
jgi:hypothetical protein